MRIRRERNAGPVMKDAMYKKKPISKGRLAKKKQKKKNIPIYTVVNNNNISKSSVLHQPVKILDTS